jgi:hypothetical protein
MNPSPVGPAYPAAEKRHAQKRHAQKRHAQRGTRDMTVPEENRPKTNTTDDVVILQEEQGEEGNENKAPKASGRTMREAMDEAGIKPEDYEE